MLAGFINFPFFRFHYPNRTLFLEPRQIPRRRRRAEKIFRFNDFEINRNHNQPDPNQADDYKPSKFRPCSHSSRLPYSSPVCEPQTVSTITKFSEFLDPNVFQFLKKSSDGKSILFRKDRSQFFSSIQSRPVNRHPQPAEKIEAEFISADAANVTIKVGTKIFLTK